MAATPVPAGGHPELSADKKSFFQLFTEAPQSTIAIVKPSSHHGEATVYFSQEEINKVAAPFKLSLVGKFSHGWPKLEDIGKFFHTLDLKQNVFVGHMDSRHVLLRFSSESDFYRVWTRDL